MCTSLELEPIGSNERPDVGIESVLVDNNKSSYARFKPNILGNNKNSHI